MLAISLFTLTFEAEHRGPSVKARSSKLLKMLHTIILRLKTAYKTDHNTSSRENCFIGPLITNLTCGEGEICTLYELVIPGPAEKQTTKQQHAPGDLLFRLNGGYPLTLTLVTQSDISFPDASTCDLFQSQRSVTFR